MSRDEREPANGARLRRCGYSLIGAAAAILVLAGCTSSFACGDRDTAGASGGLPDERSVVGYVPYWDQERGFAVAREHIESFDRISPMWYSLDAQGNVVRADDEHTNIDPGEVRFLQDRGVQVIPTLANLRNGDWTYQPVRTVLHDDALRAAHVANIVELVSQAGYDGIDLDYESLRAGDRAAYSAFVRELADALHAEGKLLTTAVHPKQSEPGPHPHNKAQDYRAIGAAADQVQVMTYDYHWSTSPAGPVAPVDWVEEIIDWTVTQIPKEKVLLGTVLLGYDWVDGGAGETVGYQDAMSLALRHDAAISRAQPGETPWFRYTDERGRGHQVWFEDLRSVNAKLALVAKYDLAGAFFWSLGEEDSRIWTETGSAGADRCTEPSG